ncbi:hypothetical protein FOZ63_003022 [Perkinsus olseni]|uniref:Uncharacterized protein n=1 Tax=Perkinsus olseni TaxID=32597 RepID=A0A7J6QWV7_PEROL|nr:hypothetical protein FOZ63_003022 [Perkinsus olseni]KAF4712813.1 hypothetical protein FOZ62_003143 [Perkinsus olseni]
MYLSACTSVHFQEVGKYTLDDANLGLALTLFVNEDKTVNWMYECKFGGFTRSYLVGPYRLADGATSAQFIIDYEWTILPVLIRQNCPFIDGIVPTDFSIIRFLNEDILTTTIRNESVRFSRVDNSYITPYLGRPSPSSNYEFLYLVLGHEELRAVLWVTCGDSPSDGAWLSFRLDRDESNPQRVEYVMSPLYQKAFEDFQDENIFVNSNHNSASV